MDLISKDTPDPKCSKFMYFTRNNFVRVCIGSGGVYVTIKIKTPHNIDTFSCPLSFAGGSINEYVNSPPLLLPSPLPPLVRISPAGQ